MKICAIISLFVIAAAAEEPFLECSYSFIGRTYECVLTIYNPDGWNNFTAIGGEHLDNFTNADVTYLYIIRNNGSITTNVPSIICDTFPNLVWLELNDLEVTEIGDEDFASCSRIERLRLDTNNIRSITANAFISLGSLDFFELSRNNLTSLPENVFVNQQNLRTLALSTNPFDHLPDGILQHLERLETFRVTNIVEVKSEWFNNTRLETLWVTNSRVTALPDSFIGLEKLRAFLFTNNEVSQIESRAFTGLTNLEVLYLDSNKLTELQADTFFDLKKLIHLFIDNNPIELIDENAFRGMDSLSSLNLQGCKISQIQPNHFQYLRSLTSISLWGNQIEELPEGVFSASNFRSISVSNNRLKILHRNSFGSLRNLDWFVMLDNEIDAVDRAIIDDAVNLRRFSLFNNLCTSVDSRDFESDREELLPALEKCFANYENITDNSNRTQ